MNKRQRIILHIVFWLLFYFKGDILNLIGNRNYQFEWTRYQSPFVWSTIIFTVIISYLILYILNRYFSTKQYLKLALGFVAVCAIYISFRYLIEEVIIWRIIGYHNYSDESRRVLYYITDNIYNVITFSFNAFFLKMIEDFFANEKEKTALVTEKLNAENAFLKNQLNPHFLFNTLNNIYSLALNQSPKTPEAVMKLSELMRYMLYESNQEKVSLETELTYLNNFIELQKIRYSGQTYVDFQVIGDVSSQRIAPLMLIPFVENAFKHGIVQDVNHPLSIQLLANQNNLSFTVKNQLANQNKDKYGGVGLENIKKRLNLIYPKSYHLEIQNDAESYSSELNLIL
ncbi:sensor histidine kinase [Emticicia sp. C21]|uniref:sensor histidine kinase n=1 Tax=Emticicia sp. C21 TaxID=2302915 RepID=UPI000E34E2DE|nr:histidine kinase [Emticicia sp. C21]RFS14679.1 histidine kinase [Emticicia sp. C21]